MEQTQLPADPSILYDAYVARDRRFDGIFFVAVASTRIYCRPICPARTAQRVNCSFYLHPAQAEAAGYRPCRRCRPERAPGRSTIDTADRLVHQVAILVGEDTGKEGNAVTAIARELHVSPQLRRVVHRELGVTPMAMVLTHRLLLARRLLAETNLTMTAIAGASGFASVRRFNDAFLKRYALPPGELRRELQAGREPRSSDALVIDLPYRPPYDWSGTLGFLAKRVLRGVEVVGEAGYARTAMIAGHTGWLRVTHSRASSSLRLEVSASLAAVLPSILVRVRSLFDLEADTDLIRERLGSDPLLWPTVAAIPGLRVTGAFDGFELALRAILGQQVTVRAAGTLSGRLAGDFGEMASLPIDGLDRVSPTPVAIAQADPDQLVRLGILRSRASTLIDLARSIVEGRLNLAPGRPPADTIRDLGRIRGIGPWTAQYIAMRALAWPDAFPKEDVALRKKLGGLTAAQAELRSQVWRPWRSYATMYLWRMP